MQSIESRQFFVYSMPVVRGVCILGVILIHIADPDSGTHYWLARQALIVANCCARYAVPVFVMLSGFHLSLNTRNESVVPFYRRTLKFLIVPYVVYSVGYSILRTRAGLSPWLLTRNLLTASAAPHLWFGLSIIQLYILHPFIARWYRRHRRHEMLVIAAFLLQIAWSVYLFVLFRHPRPLREGASIAGRLGALLFVSNIGYFIAGYYLLERSAEVARTLRNAKFVLAGVAGWVVAATVLSAYWDVGRSQSISVEASARSYVTMNLFMPLISFAALVTILPLVQKPNPTPNAAHRLLHSLGLYSYGIYYFHWFVLALLSRVLRYAIHLENSGAAFYLLMFLLVPLVTLFCVQVLAKLPFGKYVT